MDPGDLNRARGMLIAALLDMFHYLHFATSCSFRNLDIEFSFG
jgi:hypothetical protein